MELIMLSLLFAIELTEYWVFCAGVLERRLCRMYIALFGFVPYLVFVWRVPQPESQSRVVLYVLIWLILLLTIRKGNRKVQALLISIFVLTGLEGASGQIRSLMGLDIEGMAWGEHGEAVVDSIFTLVVVMAVLVVKKRFKVSVDRILKHHIERYAAVMILMTAISILMTIGGLSYAERYIPNRNFRYALSGIWFLAYLSIAILLLLLYLFYKINERLRELNAVQENLRQMQERYYESLLAKEEDTRRFRHDISKHLICLHQLAGEAGSEQVTRYIASMQEEIGQIQRRGHVTGDQTLDAIVNYYAGLMQDSAVMTITGRLQSGLHMSEYDICTVFANLLQNAYEECQRHVEDHNWVTIAIAQGMDHTEIVIRNNMASGQEKQEQGYGLQNAEETVRKNGGTLEINLGDSIYETRIRLG